MRKRRSGDTCSPASRFSSRLTIPASRPRGSRSPSWKNSPPTTRSSSGELSYLQDLFEQKVARMEGQIKMRDSQGLQAAASVVGTQQGKRLMDSIRDGIRQMEETEDALLKSRADAARQAVHTTVATVTAGSGVALALLAFALWMLQRQFQAQKRMAKVLQESKSYAESIVNTVREPLVALGPDLRVERANRSYYTAFGETETTTEGRNFFELQSGAWNDATLRDCLEKVLAQGEHFDNLQIKCQFPGMGPRTMRLNGRRFYRPDSEQSSVLLAIEDITERKSLEHVHSQFRALFESLPGLYLVLKPDLTIVAVSDAYLKATMTERAAILNRSIFEVFPDDPKETEADGESNLRASLNRVLQNGLSDTIAIQRYPIRRPNGEFEERYWSPINSPVLGVDRKVEYIIHRVEDVTEFINRNQALEGGTIELSKMQQMEAEVFHSSQEMRLANQQLRAANNELESFSYSVSHDLRAPLRHIGGFADLLAKQTAGTLDEKATRYLDTIAVSARRMGALIDDLLVFSRMGRAEMRRGRVDFSILVKDVIREMDDELKDRNIQWDIHHLPVMEADPALMRQVFLNLIANAVKYTRPRNPAVIEIGSQAETAETVFFVRDNGVGFDMAYANKLFGVFQRLHRMDEFEGTGIGLANVRRIVLRHGGQPGVKAVLMKALNFFSPSQTSR
ncbi:MAG: PAS domain-containing protein [Chthoniobacteraceae bacterium]